MQRDTHTQLSLYAEIELYDGKVENRKELLSTSLFFIHGTKREMSMPMKS
jgi:hypothetical protein